MAAHPRGRPRTFRVQLRPEARAAALMLSAVQQDGDDSPKNKGIRFWISDLVDQATCIHFKETFGISVAEFMQRVRGSRRHKYIPADARLLYAARKLLERQYELARLSGEGGAGSEAR